MATIETLDVRTMPHQDRHRLIFERLGALAPGESIRLVNDHEPKPLRYQLDAEYPQQYLWDVVEAGPDQWAIDITSRAHVIDTRPLIARGDEPFDTIMAAVSGVGDGEVLVIYAPFEPVPLEGVLSEQGFTYTADDLGGGDWRVTFVKA